MPRLRMLPLLLCLLSGLAVGQTQSASTKDKEPSKEGGKPCVSTDAAKEVLRLGRSLGYRDDEILEAYGEDPCAALSYLRQENQQKSAQPTPTPRYWFERAPSLSELIVDLGLLLLALAILVIRTKWIERIPLLNRLHSLPKTVKELFKWAAIGFLVREAAAFTVSFIAAFGESSRWFRISPSTQNWLLEWLWWIVIATLVLIASAKQAWKKRPTAARLEQTRTKDASVP